MDPNVEKLIDLWEERSALWDPWDVQNRNRTDKDSAYAAIAEAMGEDWTSEMVKRKIESLHAYYKFNKRKMEGSIASAGTSASKGPWAYYDRLKGFLSARENTQAGSSGSLTKKLRIPGGLKAGGLKVERHSSNLECSLTRADDQLSESSNVPSVSTSRPLCERTLGQDNKNEKARESAVELALASSRLRQKRISETREREANQSFGMYIADRLGHIKNKISLIRLRQQINNLIDEALLEDFKEE